MNKFFSLNNILSVLLGSAIGLTWYLCDGGKVRKKASDKGVSYDGSNDRIKELPVKIYRGAWNKKGYLEVSK